MHSQSIGLRRAFNLKEAAEALGGVSIGFLRLESQRGHLQVTRLGRRVLITAEELDRYLAEGAVRKGATEA
jgi:excisionase family DNA binding protein